MMTSVSLSVGVHIARKIDKLGMWSSDTAEVFFDDVHVPCKNIIGQEGMGFTYQMLQFQEERLWAVANGEWAPYFPLYPPISPQHSSHSNRFPKTLYSCCSPRQIGSWGHLVQAVRDVCLLLILTNKRQSTCSLADVLRNSSLEVKLHDVTDYDPHMFSLTLSSFMV